MRESEGFIVAVKPGNSGGAKGPYRECVFAKEERSAWTLVPLRNKRLPTKPTNRRVSRK